MSRILLADDSPHAQRMGEQILSEEGFEVVTVSDGDSALLRLEDVDPDLVLAGVGMAHRTGYEICQYVKLSPRHKHVRVILATGVKDQLDEAEARRVQADGIVQKPFQASVLLGVVKPLIEMAVKERGSDPSPAAGVPSGPGKRPAPKAPPQGPTVALIDPERVQAAVTVALDASMSGIIDEITEKVLIALSAR
jgi:CheY-like chemotaxis protein